MPYKVLFPLCLTALLCSVVMFLAGQAQGAPVDPTPIDTWTVPRGNSVDIIENNQVPGNYKVKNDAGTTAVKVAAYDANGVKVAGPHTLEGGQTTPQMGVPLNGKLTVENLGTKTATGTVWKFS